MKKSELIPVYIGDDKTDEDAFKSLTNCITVKVGKSRKSLAKYYLKNTDEVIQFLEWLNNLN